MGSTDLFSSEKTSRWFGPLLQFLWPGLAGENLGQVLFLLRKTGHLFEYSVLAILLLRAFRGGLSSGSPLNGSQAAAALAVALIVAALDEWHQSRLPTRFGSGWDVALDGLGAAIGVGGVWLWRRARSAR